MKLIATLAAANWRDILDDNVQVDFVDVPTGETKEVVVDDVHKTVYVTEERLAFGFQTETGRGKGIQWIPVEEIDPVFELLSDYAKDIESIDTDLSSGWTNPVETIRETISRIPRRDAEGNYLGQFDISFRVRQGKGSKSLTVPAEDFPTFVEKLKEYRSGILEAAEKLLKAREAKPKTMSLDKIKV